MRRREILFTFLVAGFLVFWLGHQGHVGLGPWIRHTIDAQGNTLPNNHDFLPSWYLPHHSKDSTVSK